MTPGRHTVLGTPLAGPWPEGTRTAVFGLGCFWGAEKAFWQMSGVVTTAVGYAGGSTPNPTYQEACSGRTGQAEVVLVAYDPARVSYDELLKTFWEHHDPTQGMRQGNDVGTQYRSAVFYHDDEQKKLAEEYKQKLDEAGAFRAPIVTEITEFKQFFPAEDYHQNYYRLNPREGYCSFVIRPKVEKIREVFADKLKTEK